MLAVTVARLAQWDVLFAKMLHTAQAVQLTTTFKTTCAWKKKILCWRSCLRIWSRTRELLTSTRYLEEEKHCPFLAFWSTSMNFGSTSTTKETTGRSWTHYSKVCRSWRIKNGRFSKIKPQRSCIKSWEPARRGSTSSLTPNSTIPVLNSERSRTEGKPSCRPAGSSSPSTSSSFLSAFCSSAGALNSSGSTDSPKY